jgi:hypothetical protein
MIVRTVYVPTWYVYCSFVDDYLFKWMRIIIRIKKKLEY